MILGRPLHRLSAAKSIDLPARPALPGLARTCPDLRVKPTRFQAYSSRAGTLEGSRLAKHKLPQTTTTTTSNSTSTRTSISTSTSTTTSTTTSTSTSWGECAAKQQTSSWLRARVAKGLPTAPLRQFRRAKRSKVAEFQDHTLRIYEFCRNFVCWAAKFGLRIYLSCVPGTQKVVYR